MSTQARTRQENAAVETPAPEKTIWQVVLLPVDQIGPSPYQPRVLFDPVEMEELVASVKTRSVQQPIIVRSAKPQLPSKGGSSGKAALNGKASTNGKASSNEKTTSHAIPSPHPRYELVAGERRLRACKQAKKRWIPAIVRDDLSDAQAAELALLENVQRSNLSCIEEARGYKRLMLEFRMKEERLSKKVGKSVSTIREMMKLLQLPESVQVLLWQKQLTAAHGYALLPLAAFPDTCLRVAQSVVKNKLTASSLSSIPLPNYKELKKASLIVELDHKTKFDWREVCGKCPHKAYVHSGYSAFCLLPEEWEKKQIVALVRERDRNQQESEEEAEDAATVFENARRENNGVVTLDQLASASYQLLSAGNRPAACSPGCPCFREVVDEDDPTQKHPICLDPERLQTLRQAEREAQQQAWRNHCNALFESAKSKLQLDMEKGELQRITLMLATPILRSMYDQNGYIESWRQGAAEIAAELQVPLPDEFIEAEEESQAYSVLEALLQDGVSTERVLLLCVCLFLAEEASCAIRYHREMPGIEFLLEARQASLETDDGAVESGVESEDYSLEQNFVEELDAPDSDAEGSEVSNTPASEYSEDEHSEQEESAEEFSPVDEAVTEPSDDDTRESHDAPSVSDEMETTSTEPALSVA